MVVPGRMLRTTHGSIVVLSPEKLGERLLCGHSQKNHLAFVSGSTASQTPFCLLMPLTSILLDILLTLNLPLWPSHVLTAVLCVRCCELFTNN